MIRYVIVSITVWFHYKSTSFKRFLQQKGMLCVFFDLVLPFAAKPYSTLVFYCCCPRLRVTLHLTDSLWYTNRSVMDSRVKSNKNPQMSIIPASRVAGDSSTESHRDLPPHPLDICRQSCSWSCSCRRSTETGNGPLRQVVQMVGSTEPHTFHHHMMAHPSASS